MYLHMQVILLLLLLFRVADLEGMNSLLEWGEKWIWDRRPGLEPSSQFIRYDTFSNLLPLSGLNFPTLNEEVVSPTFCTRVSIYQESFT